MAFKPINQRVSREPFDDGTENEFSLSTDQDIRDGKLVLRGTPNINPNPDLNWQGVQWGQTSQFFAVPDETSPSPNWIYTSQMNPFEASAQEFPFAGRTISREDFYYKEEGLPFFGGDRAQRSSRERTAVIRESDGSSPRRVRTILGRRTPQAIGRDVLQFDNGETVDIDYIYQSTSDQASQGYWIANSNNATGWTLELRAMIEGTSELVLDDGTRRAELYLASGGIYQATVEGAEQIPVLRLAVPWNDKFVRVRIAGWNNDLFMLSGEGPAYVGTSMFTSESVDPALKVGHLGRTRGLLMLDYLHQSHLGVFLDIEDDVRYVQSVSEFSTTTPSLHHQRAVDSYLSAIVKSVPPYSGGTTKVLPQYNNSNVGTWTNFGSAVTLIDEYQEIDLSSLPVESDGSDQIRFVVSQQAATTSDKPAPVDEITVLTDFNGSLLRVSPEYGPTAGGNSVNLYSDGDIVFNTSDIIYVQGVQVPPGDVNQLTTAHKVFTVPDGGTPGIASVILEDSGGTSYFTDRPYRYISDYDKGVDRYHELDQQGLSTRSPFRMKNEVPDGEINLAYLATPGIEAQSHVGLIDLSYIEEGNIVSGIGAPELLTEGTATSPDGVDTFTYGEAPTTTELTVSGTTAGWRELDIPSPLFYKYLVGRGRYYVRTENTLLNLEEFRDSIKVHYQDGTPVSLEEYPWDILVSTNDVDGNPLPPKTFSVVVLTQKKFISGQTVFVTVSVVDRANRFALLQGHTEVINPEPIVLVGAERQGFSVSAQPDGSFSLEIRS